MTLAEFWAAGTAEVFAVIEAAQRRRRESLKMGLFTAWQTEAYARRSGSLPDIKDEFAVLDRASDQPTDQTSIDEGVASRRREMERIERREPKVTPR